MRDYCTATPSGPTGQGDNFSDIRTILLLGSGALKIGEAGEFDYSGSQAIKAFKEEGKRVILVNPNIATNQTSWGLADTVYFVPITPAFVERVIHQEKPDAIALSFGGQTALNCGLALEESGVLAREGITVLGTSIDAIRRTEDRALFKEALASIGVPTPRSFCCQSMNDALRAAETLGYPVIARRSFALGGKGSGRAISHTALHDLLALTFTESPTVLIEEDLTGWKEIEYEVVRDAADNCITVCNMENVDPLGIHTGESIVVAPSQTLDNQEYHLLRNVALRVVRHFGIVGECNIQYALDTRSRAYQVIEVNARLSRSSALASKATGYPLAFVAAKLALGRTLEELPNTITRTTCADFEPALDYVAVKMPRWDLQKFPHVSHLITSEMKSVGEVMAIGRTFEEALQKAVRMLNVGADGLFPHPFHFSDLANALTCPTPQRLFAIAEAFTQGWGAEQMATMTKIDRWFLERIQYCVRVGEEIAAIFPSPSAVVEGGKPLTLTLSRLEREQFLRAKRAGFSDASIAALCSHTPDDVRAWREEAGIRPSMKQIDTLAGEFPAQTNYLYLTYHGTEDDVDFDTGNPGEPLTPALSRWERGDRAASQRANQQRVIVLGSGPYSIGSSVEFDWCCVQAAHELEHQGYYVAMINSNPETVSTDYDECSTLFFEELTEERVRDIAALFSPMGIVVSMGGQIPNSLAPKLAHAGLAILGTDPINIDRAEDRHKFSALLDALGIDQPAWQECSDLLSASAFAERVGYPVIVRPSYVLSGSAMTVVYSSNDLLSYIEHAARVSRDAPVVISKFENLAKEIEFDGIAEDGQLLAYAIGEHIEHAGVHSGDATIVLPPQRVTVETLRQMKGISTTIANALHISGPFNIQFLAKENHLKVIECNLRASRTFPFVSKVTGVNFAKLATQALIGVAPRNRRYQTIDLDIVAVKAPQFSFGRLHGADSRLGVEMASTGEVGCFGHNAEQALLTALLSTSFRLPQKNILFTIGTLEDKLELFPSISLLAAAGYALFATQNTHAFLNDRDIPSALVYKISEPSQPNITDYIKNRRFDLIINIPLHPLSQDRTDGYALRRLAADSGIPLLTNVQLVKRLIEAIIREKPCSLPLLPWPALLGLEVTRDERYTLCS
ncbi:carbamoyl phosphate synthase large subunit [Candidatus Peribacteria bacterium RIFCSPHIGHO2_12_FULL_54_10]|nr:MAG: carbamoyl phosphate synthase large subunit [Candidatus Peribacteria bacterium RIFCSPHIGHO2_12_FULL_54_10]